MTKKEKKKKNREGQLLVASPKMPDPNFRRICVVLIQDEDDGAMGVCLNRPTEQTVKDVWSGLPKDQRKDTECKSEEVLYAGGPVFGPLVALHTSQKWSEVSICPDVFLSAEQENLVEIVKTGESFRLFSGYAGWSPGQLDKEINAGGWFVLPCEKKYIFFAEQKRLYENDVWKEAWQDYGQLLWKALGIKHIPRNSLTN